MATTEIGPAVPSQGAPKHLWRVLVLWFFLSVLGVVAALLFVPHWLPTAASDSTKFANTTIIVFTAISMPVALFVWVFLGYSMVHFRVEGRTDDDGPALHLTGFAQIGWLAITAALCLFLLVWGLFGMYEQSMASTQNALIVRATGQQWTWTYTYPQYGITTHTLDLPLDRPVLFKVTSLDVLHGFAIQQLGVRLDANPGSVLTTPVVTPSRLGNFETRCVELCGTYHSFMFTPANVVTSAHFRTWVMKQGGHV
jgi:cytochrome c oxidase subunit 2